MAESKTSAGLPEVDPQQGLKDNKKTLEEKIARLKKLPHSEEHDHEGAIARAERHLAEVDRALRKESK